MTQRPITLESLHEAYRRWSGEPLTVSTFRHTGDEAAAPSALDVLCYQAPPEEKLPPPEQYTMFVTAGLSTREMTGDVPRLELYWDVSRRLAPAEIRVMAEALSQIAVLPFYRDVRFAPGVVVEDLNLPVFKGMRSLLVTNMGVYGEEWLPGLNPPVKILCLKALFQSETEGARRIGEYEVNRQFQIHGVDWGNPDRPPVALQTG